MSLYVSLVKFTPEGLATMKEKGLHTRLTPLTTRDSI